MFQVKKTSRHRQASTGILELRNLIERRGCNTVPGMSMMNRDELANPNSKFRGHAWTGLNRVEPALTIQRSACNSHFQRFEIACIAALMDWTWLKTHRLYIRSQYGIVTSLIGKHMDDWSVLTCLDMFWFQSDAFRALLPSLASICKAYISLPCELGVILPKNQRTLLIRLNFPKRTSVYISYISYIFVFAKNLTISTSVKYVKYMTSEIGCPKSLWRSLWYLNCDAWLKGIDLAGPYLEPWWAMGCHMMSQVADLSCNSC